MSVFYLSEKQCSAFNNNAIFKGESLHGDCLFFSCLLPPACLLGEEGWTWKYRLILAVSSTTLSAIPGAPCFLLLSLPPAPSTPPPSDHSDLPPPQRIKYRKRQFPSPSRVPKVHLLQEGLGLVFRSPGAPGSRRLKHVASPGNLKYYEGKDTW